MSSVRPCMVPTARPGPRPGAGVQEGDHWNVGCGPWGLGLRCRRKDAEPGCRMWPRALSEAGAGSAGLEEPSPSLAVAPLPPGPRDMRSDAGARGAGPRGRSQGRADPAASPSILLPAPLCCTPPGWHLTPASPGGRWPDMGTSLGTGTSLLWHPGHTKGPVRPCAAPKCGTHSSSYGS